MIDVLSSFCHNFFVTLSFDKPSFAVENIHTERASFYLSLDLLRSHFGWLHSIVHFLHKFSLLARCFQHVLPVRRERFKFA
jgi:hypothetical protein